MLNCGIHAFGKMGKIRANAIENSDKGKLVAIYDIDPRRSNPRISSRPIPRKLWNSIILTLYLYVLQTCTSQLFAFRL